jgi:hypothetical protein
MQSLPIYTLKGIKHHKFIYLYPFRYNLNLFSYLYTLKGIE